MKKLILTQILLLSLSACASHGKETSVAATLPAGQTELTSQHPTTDAFLKALQAGNYPAATQTFDARVKAAIGDLEKVWTQTTGHLGALQKWRTMDRLKKDKYEIQAVVLDFEKGTQRMTITVSMETGEIAGFFFTKDPTAAAPQNPELQATGQLEKIKVGKDPYPLDGVILYPKGEGPFPAVVLVHGSGPLDMDSKVAANAPFRDMAEGLAARGIAVLRYNKRFFQYPEQSLKITVREEVIEDAVAAVSLLKTKPKVKASQIFIVGHSLGAQLAPDIATESAAIQGLILLAPPARPLQTILVEQLQYLKQPEHVIQKVQDEFKQLESDSASDRYVLGAPAGYWRDLSKRNAIETAKKLKIPMLIMRGERDYQVVATDFKLWEQGLAEKHNVVFASIPEANHLFIKGQGKPGPEEYGIPGKVDAAVIKTMADFIVASASTDSLNSANLESKGGKIP